ncbi:hypothetical protein GF337_07520 [candidate division KSB1 bacterium]|nr:hypothetical protein [candidate division KSB1 bacterium]
MSISEDVAYLCRNLIKKLVEVEDAYAELEDLSKLPAFDSFNKSFVSFISNLALKGSDEEKRKELIASVSQFFLDHIIKVTRDMPAKHALASFLGIDTNLLPESNNKSENLLSNDSNRNTGSPPSDFEQLQENFADEVLKTISSLNQDYAAAAGNTRKFLNGWLKYFEHIKFISIVHGYEQLETISERMIRIAKVQLNGKESEFELLSDLYDYAITALKRLVTGSISLADFLTIVHTLDHFLETGTFEKGISDEKIDSDDETNTSEILTNDNISSQYIDNVDDNNVSDADFKLPGEDDPELLALIKEMSDNRQNIENDESTYSIKEIKEENLDRRQNGPLIEKPIRLAKEHENAIDSNIKIFIEETTLYFRLIKSALVALDRNPEDESGLEDLELASNALKGEAIKLGFEKLSRIPNLIEDIAKYAIMHRLQLPDRMLDAMSRASILLQSVKRDRNYEEKFRQIQKELHNYFFNLKKRLNTNREL